MSVRGAGEETEGQLAFESYTRKNKHRNALNLPPHSQSEPKRRKINITNENGPVELVRRRSSEVVHRSAIIVRVLRRACCWVVSVRVFVDGWGEGRKGGKKRGKNVPELATPAKRLTNGSETRSSPLAFAHSSLFGLDPDFLWGGKREEGGG